MLSIQDGERETMTMDPKSRWEKERQEGKNQRIQAILEAAKSVFLQKGIEKATMQDIAREAHIGIATVFRHFPKKDKLIVAVVTQMVESQIPVFEAIADGEGSCIQKVEQLLDLFISYTQEEHSFNTKLLEAFESYQSLMPEPLEDIGVYEEVSHKIIMFYSRIFEEGRRDGSIRPDLPVHETLSTISNNFGTYAKKLSAQRNVLLPHMETEPEQQLLILKQIFLQYLRP
ncbi:TetR/AcrR family transcriptional regulator [Paenibacillus spongiae]|uniref:TetR/AcrR family transcriptional regulator n=1 Tax=Paenibacillus spongiae TaxID=2909671 RepID=A0ABY5S6Z5_9BACL|nr:TetR/AcrR family transcriptional regulator [Paenibacillus spongiae]UVI29696.1 TetR/AcrR family transcriptional regulator [Paenibacillus spongiae]